MPRDASVEVEAVAMVGTVSSISIIVRIDNVIVKLSVVIVINQQKYQFLAILSPLQSFPTLST